MSPIKFSLSVKRDSKPLFASDFRLSSTKDNSVFEAVLPWPGDTETGASPIPAKRDGKPGGRHPMGKLCGPSRKGRAAPSASAAGDGPGRIGLSSNEDNRVFGFQKQERGSARRTGSSPSTAWRRTRRALFAGLAGEGDVGGLPWDGGRKSSSCDESCPRAAAASAALRGFPLHTFRKRRTYRRRKNVFARRREGEGNGNLRERI